VIGGGGGPVSTLPEARVPLSVPFLLVVNAIDLGWGGECDGVELV
jgi:hypothetical protein